MTRLLLVAAVLSIPLSETRAAEPTKNIVETAISAGSFTTLVAAVKAADLADALSGPGPLTVFAPTDEAFAKLPPGTIEKLLADKSRLQAVLKHHVVSGKVMAADVVKLSTAKTLNGTPVGIEVDGKGVRIDKASVVQTDIECSNGVIHVIDAVLLPPVTGEAQTPAKKSGEKLDIVETALAAGSFKTLAAALEAADLVGALQGSGPFTVFAPTDEAFAKLPKGTLDALLKDQAKLQKVLKYHVVSGKITSAQVVRLPCAQTLAGQAVHFSACQGVKINNAHVVKADVQASNGVIHVIDTVLIPR